MQLVDTLRTGWAAYRRYPIRLSASALVLSLAQLSTTAGVSLILPQGLAVPALLLLAGMLEVGQLTSARRALNGETPRVLHVFEPLSARPLDTALIVLAIGAGMLFAFVGLFVTLVLFMFAPLYMAEGQAARDALLESARRVIAAPTRAVGLCAMLMGIKVLGVLCFGVGLLVTTPLCALIVAAAAKSWPAPAPRAYSAVAVRG